MTDQAVPVIGAAEQWCKMGPGRWASPSSTDDVPPAPNPRGRAAPPADLTAREHEIAALAAQGLRNSEIAKKLFVAESTVRTHLRAIFQKLDIDRRARLAERLK